MERGTETKTAVRWFWAWNARKEENWLEQMAREGWYLANGGIIFTFVKGRPAEVRYRLDWRTGTAASLKDYFDLCRDAGWERVCSFGSWHYFRTADATAPELYTDRDSLVERYWRLLALIVVVTIPNLMSLLLNLGRSTGRFEHLYSFARVTQFVLVTFLLYGIVKLLLFIRQLKAAGGRP